jgi:hypothetical protein
MEKENYEVPSIIYLLYILSIIIVDLILIFYSLNLYG